MRKIMFGKLGKIMLPVITALAMIGVFLFAPAATINVTAASVTQPINLIYYGWHDTTVDNSILSANPEFLVDNSPVGPWRGNASISKFTSAGIKYFEYIDGGYEGTTPQPIPNDLQSNLNYITAAAGAGAYGVFLDEVSSYPSAASTYYLSQIAARAHSLGLKVVFNVGVDSWSDSLMAYCDYINSSEIWNNAPLTSSQVKWASRTWLLSQNVTNATTAAYLTNAAKSAGINAHYACTSYGSLPTWLSTYVAQINSVVVAPVVASGIANNITVSGATLNGTLSSLGTSSTVSVSFDWGLTTAYGNTTPVIAKTSTGAVSAALTGLVSNTAYHYRVKAVGASTVYGSDVIFTTASIVVPPVDPVTGNTTGTVVGTPVSSGGGNEYSLNLRITSSTVYGVTVGQQLWVAATTTSFPNLLTPGATLTGNLDKSLGWWVIKASTTPVVVPPVTPPAPVTGNTTGTVVGTPISTGGGNEYSLNLRITSSTVYGVTVGQQLWVAATTTSFPNLLTPGATLTGNLDKSLGWWVIKASTTPVVVPPVTPPAPVTGNTTGTVVGTPISTGGGNEYSLNLRITSSTVYGVTVGQQLWVAATTTSFPYLLTPGATLTGNLDKSLGWWVIK